MLRAVHNLSDKHAVSSARPECLFIPNKMYLTSSCLSAPQNDLKDPVLNVTDTGLWKSSCLLQISDYKRHFNISQLKQSSFQVVISFKGKTLSKQKKSNFTLNLIIGCPIL
ncbi:hypothetical protein ILYODFUR_032770, partial [Ilyodon furcidens]